MITGFSASQWNNKKVAFLGDSITDACHVGTTKNYWEFLSEFLGITHLVYGINGHCFSSIKAQAEQLYAEHRTDVDAIVIFCGTNDYNSSTPMGQFWTLETKDANCNGTVMPRVHKCLITGKDSFCGRINEAMTYIKTTFPEQQIILCTPIHRGFAEFSETNVQQEEFFANAQGLFIEDYAETIRKAGQLWSVPVIDLFEKSGLYPCIPASYSQFFHDAQNDLLHPNANGHRRIALTMAYQMLALPATFRE